jgi:membrane protein DedA with SNARE-associated domain
VTSWLAHYGAFAVFLLMLVDAVFPAASELVMVYAGALASGALAHRVDVFGWHGTGLSAYLAVVLAGVVGYQLGSIGGWWIGKRGGRPFLERRGRWLHLSPDRLDRAERWFDRHGAWAVFLGRLTPVVRSFISIPAGAFQTPLGAYTLLTLAGSAIWCFVFAGAGWALGSSYERLHHTFSYVNVVVVVIAAIAVSLVAARETRRRRARERRAQV